MSDFTRSARELSPAEKRALLEQSLRKRARNAQTFPLSYAQERLWFLSQWEPLSAAHNIFTLLRLQGPLHISTLERCIAELVHRHASLRTIFLTIEEHPAQVIVPHQPVFLPLVDLSGISEQEQTQQVQSLAQQEGARPFDLRRGPLLRTMLLRLDAAGHIFLVTMHHIISDGWSMGIFNRELGVLYEAFSQGQPSPLIRLPIQYGSYARWQRRQAQGEGSQQHLEYWRKQLHAAPSLLALPTDRPRPPVQTFAGAIHQFVLSADQCYALKSLSQREHITLFTMLLAAFQTLLARYSQQDDISVGTYIAGRTNVQTEGLIGFFINNLVLRTDLSGDPTFRTLLQRVSLVAQEAYEHQEIPFEQLLQVLQPERNPSHTPLFQVMLIYQNMPRHELSLPGLTIQPLGIEGTRTDFDLSLWVTDTSEGRLLLTFDYNTDLFDTVTIERMAGHFQTLLQGIVADPDRRLSQLPILSVAERQQVLHEWNTTTVPFALDTSLEQLIAAQATRTPDTIAVVCDEQHLTYAELHRRAGQLAYTMQSQGVGPEVLVGICLERSLEMIIALLGVLKAGGAYVPLDPTYPLQRLAFIMQQTGMALLLTQSYLASRLPSPAAEKLLCLDTDWPAIAQGSQPLQHQNNRAGQMVYVIYTSGSTGAPKGVAVEQRSLRNFAQAAARLFGIMPGDRVLQFASLSFDASAEEIYPCLIQGGTLLLRNETMLQSPAHFWQTCRAWGVTVLDLPTAYWHELAASAEVLVTPPELRLVIIGGEQARAELLALWQHHVSSQVELLNTYGPTEATVVATAHEVRLPERRGAFEAAMIGRAIAHVEVYVLDHWGQPVPVGVPGELYIGGEALARGYLDHPALTAERFVPHPFAGTSHDAAGSHDESGSYRASGPGARLYRTGDLVRRLADGSLEYRGRLDQQVKLRGVRIELGEIEAVLARHPAVREAVVLLREDLPGEKRLVAYVVGQPSQPVSSSELRSLLQQHLPGYMLPASFVQMDALPQTPNGKIDRRALPTPQALSRGREQVWEVPRTPAEELLAEIWMSVLHVEQVGRYDHFFELGGHSLLATRLVARVRELFKVELPLHTIFDTPTLAELAQHIGTQQPLALPPLVAAPPQETFPLSYAQQRLWFLDQLQPGSPAYNIAVAVRFSGPLQLKLLHESLLAVMQRQPSLRTIFISQQGHPIQMILPRMPLPMPLIDLRQLSAAMREAAVSQIAWQEAQQPFDLAQGPLLRTTMLRLDEQTQVLLLTMHHIITDGWSMSVFFQELAACYRASLQHEPPRLPELAIHYADYACWQRSWLEGQGARSQEEAGPLEQQLAYWRSHLEGAPPLLDLPTDHPRPQEQGSRGAHYGFALSSQLVSSLRQLCRQEGTTLFMVLLTAFGALLARYSGQEDLVVGTPIANRSHAQLEGIIGFFVNTLALRLSLVGRPTVREMLRRVRTVALDAYAHQDVPFERVVEALHPQRHLSHTPLFQVVFAWQNMAAAALELPEVRVDLLAMESGIARFDLTLTMQERAEDVVGVLEYRRDLFEPGTIERLVEHLCMQLERMVATPEQPLATLPLLTPAEQEQVLLDWNETRTPYLHDQGLAALFEAQVKQAPEAIALVFEEQQVSYGELDRRANHLAQYLHQWGVRTETLVGLCLERSMAMVIAILGILKAGGAYLPLDPASPPERLAFVLHDARASVLLSEQSLLQGLPAVSIPLLCLDRDWPTIASTPPAPAPLWQHPDHLAYVIYTSGSTGTPKGVLVPHRQVTRLFASTQTQFRFGPQDHWTLFHSIAFDFSVWELWGALLFGGRLTVVPWWQSREPESFFHLLQEQQISVLNLTPSAFHQLVVAASSLIEGKSLLALRLVIFGGEALDLASVRAWMILVGEHGPHLVNMYGITETTVHVTWQPLSLTVINGSLKSPIGRPLPDLQVYVLDGGGQPVPVGVVGELYVGGAGVTRGYLGRPDLTAQRFVPHPWSRQPGARLYRSGDLARYTREGQLEYLGRNDAQVKLRGFRIELGEIEAALQEHPSVREAVVVVQERQQGEKQLVAYIVPASAQTPSLSALRTFLSVRLPAHMLPAAFVPLEGLPLTANGKLDRRALPDPDSGRPELGKEYMAPQNEIERTLAQIWSQILRIQQVGVHDNFFELGGDSILSIQIVAKAHAAGLSLTPRHLFQHQTIAQLAAVVGSIVLTQAEPEVVEGAMPLMPIHHWFFARQLAQPQHWNQAVLLQARQPLDPALLAQALQAVLKQHDGLRLRAHQQSAGWQLSFATADAPLPFVRVDLSGLPAAQQQASLQAAATALQASLNLMEGPLLRVALFDLGAGEPARLLLAIHHLVVDIISWSILLSDLQTAYDQLQHGQAVQLPVKTTSWQRWARRLHNYAQTAAVRAQFAYWQGQAWEQVRPLPMDQPAEQEANREETARALVVTLSVAQTQALLSEMPRAYHTQINDVLLTALVQAFARWTGQSCLLVHLEGHGREDLFEDVDLSRTVGWFTSLIPLVLSLPESREPGAALMQIKEQLRTIPQEGISFGLLRYLCQDAAVRERLAALPQPQVAFNYAGRSAIETKEEGLFAPAVESSGISSSRKNQRAHIVEINSGIQQGQLYLEWIYSNRLHQHTTIERLAGSYIEMLEMLIEHCRSPQAGGFTPSDFPQARLSQSALDALLAVLRETGEETRAGSARIEAIYPLSPLQEGMLFHSLYAPESEVYFEQVGYGVRGPLDGEAWRGAWEQVVQQHAILRTLFVWEQLERPLQVVRSQVRVPSEEHDWRAYSPEEQAERLEQWKRADRARGFVLGQAPLLRVALHRLSDEWGYVSWSFHHLLLDGWSVATVVGEVFACYQALRQGSRRRLPTRRSYGDYLIWLQQQDLAQAEGYWRERLRGFGAPTPLGVDRPGHSLHGTDDDYHHQHIQLSVAMTARLQTLAREQQVTLNTLVQGAWALLLARYSGQDDVVFGVTVSGRPAGLAGVEEMVGLFINTLPVRVQVYAEQRLIPWLQQLQQQQAEARQYEYSPLTQVQGWSEVPRGQPLFESLLVFENYPIDVSTARIQESQLTIEHVEAVERTNYPLTITVVPHAGTRIRISYMGKRFTHEAIRRMLGHFQALLEGMMAYPERRLADLPMLTAEERQQLLFEWNAASPVAAQERCLSQIFEQQAALLTDAVAVVYEEEQLTYGELNIKANCVAWYLRHLGVGPEVLVGLCLERSVAMIVAILGILKAGGAYLPLDPASPPERLAFVLHDARASVLLSEQSLLPRLPAVSIPLLCLDRDWATIASVPPAPVPLRQHADQLAYVIYTSGSTGTPKGVLVPHRQVTRLFASTQSQFRFGPQDHWTLFHSIAFDFSVWELWGALLFGGRLTVVPWWQSREPESFWHLLAMQQISVLNLTPSAFRQLVTIIATASVKPALALRLVIFGGEALDLSSVRSWWSYVGEHGPHLVNMYGITETTVHVTACPLSREVMSEGQASPIGRPLPDLQVYVLDGRGQPVPVGVVGELYVGGAGVTRGYLGRPELTAQRFVPHPWSREPGARLYRSGDLARYTQEGQLEYLGRNDAQVKLRGFRIELGEIEAVLQEHPSVREAVVMLREDDPGDARLVAYVVTSQQHPTTSSELRRHLQQRLPDYMVPSSLVLLEALPLTSNGKVDREALPQPGQIQVEHKSAYVAPRTRMEEELASIWEQVLQRESIGVYDHFLELGGDSLLATQIIARIRHAFQVDLSPRNLLRTATIATLAEQIEAAQRERQTTRIPSIKRLARPLS